MQKEKSHIYLVPSFLSEDAKQTIPPYIIDAVKNCQVFYVENERTARRFLKVLWKEMVIDDYEWIAIHKVEDTVRNKFRKHIREGKNIAILSEAGCPGIADPGQILVDVAHHEGAIVKPLVGPSSILLALMGSGLNGQNFMFRGYLPIDTQERIKEIHSFEDYSIKNNCTILFIETPYRNNQMMEMLLRQLKPTTRLCVAINLTAANEQVITKTVADWKKKVPSWPKEPAMFCIGT